MRHLFTSDLHLGHEKVAGLRGFECAVEHDKEIGERWASVVGERDIVWVLGDFSCGAEDYALDLLHGLPGRKRLIVGNHDAAHPMHRRAAQALARYGNVFEYVAMAGRVKLAGRDVLLSHFPWSGERAGDGRERQFRHWRIPFDEGGVLLHGHTHRTDQRAHGAYADWNPGLAGSSWAPHGSALQVHVGLDAWDLTPVHAHIIEKLIKENDQ
ncbi:calcineurin-like phosphoesterase family protein [Haloactinopolyspora alba]|uniref:Calcineurin-like phosphoesterase family protein n=1 Tax=Haloactinopolyspora alba TaxID=648780 RepID=A0A2P8E3R0_9ACTN|nr:metallophosphoesterase family protein [Haloactinopolyspora alba]PSL04100.1 calcineurin-like phosphoesterase family protein [Haloactinopolyspora alba]